MFKRHRIFLWLSLFMLAPLLTGCDAALLDPKGIIAAAQKKLLIEATVLMLLVVIPTILMTFWIVWRYRASNRKATYAPNWSHSRKVELFCWFIPTIIIIILGIMTWVSSHKLDPYRPLDSKQKPIVIEAVSLNWKWLFIYPDQDIATINYLQLPVDVPVRFMITSDAPMNSMAIPRLAGQIYAMGGMRTKLNIMATEQGTYRGQSTNYSGDGFADMHFPVKVTDEQAFNNWVNHVKQQANPLTVNVYNQLTKDSINKKPIYYSSVANNLFNKVIMKYMMPNAELAVIDPDTKKR